MTKTACATAPLTAFFLCVSGPAHAHLVNTRFGDFYAGMVHPITALEHIVPWIALGLLFGSQPAGKEKWGIGAFVGGVIIGLLANNMWAGIETPDLINILSFIVLGLIVALAFPLPTYLLCSLAVIFGASHGYTNGSAVTEDTNIFLFLPGVAVASYIVVLLMAAITAALAQRWQTIKIGVRAVGSWIFAIGLLFFAFSVAG